MINIKNIIIDAILLLFWFFSVTLVVFGFAKEGNLAIIKARKQGQHAIKGASEFFKFNIAETHWQISIIGLFLVIIVLWISYKKTMGEIL